MFHCTLEMCMGIDWDIPYIFTYNIVSTCAERIHGEPGLNCKSRTCDILQLSYKTLYRASYGQHARLQHTHEHSLTLCVTFMFTDKT